MATRKMKASSIRIGDFLSMPDGTHGWVETIIHISKAHADFQCTNGMKVTLTVGHPDFPFEDKVHVSRPASR